MSGRSSAAGEQNGADVLVPGAAELHGSAEGGADGLAAGAALQLEHTLQLLEQPRRAGRRGRSQVALGRFAEFQEADFGRVRGRSGRTPVGAGVG